MARTVDTASGSGGTNASSRPEGSSATSGAVGGGALGAPLDTTLTIETPEHIAFSYLLAGPARRAAAYLVDLLVRGLFAMVVVIALAIGSSGLGSEFVGGLGTGVLLVIFFALEWGYFVLFEVLAGGTSPGKRAFRLRVIHQTGRPLSPGESLLRNLLRAADLLPMAYAIGLLSMLLDRDFRRLGDLVAGTVVVHEPRTRLSERATMETPVIAGLVSRPRLSPEERSALALFHRRLPYLSQARASELADLVAPRFRARFGVPDAPAVELLSALHERGESR